MPFNIDVSAPADSMQIASFPSDERDNRLAIQNIITAEHYEGDGTHQFGFGATGARPLSPLAGNVFYDTTLGVFLICLVDGTWSPATQTAIEVGTIQLTAQNYAGVPSLWLPCDGAGLNRITYVDLFDKIGYAYGGSDPTFLLPDLGNNIPAGLGTDLAYDAVGKVGGVKETTLLEAHIPEHTHGNVGNHQHLIETGGGSPGSATSHVRWANADTSQDFTTPAGGHEHTAFGQTVPTPVPTVDPYVTVGFIIYTGVP